MQSIGKTGIAFVGVILGFVILRTMGGAPSGPEPEVLSTAHSTIAAGFEAAEQSGKPVFVLATADWCGPCQSFKARTLSDPQVSSYLAESAEVVKIDLTDRNNAASGADAQYLGVRTIPAAFMLFSENGQEVRRVPMPRAGNPGEFLSWARSTTN